MKVKTLMNERVWTVTKNQSVSDIVDTMDFHGIGAVPVVEDGRPIGIITDRDVAMHIASESKPMRQWRASELMTWNPLCVLEEDDLTEAVQLMRRKRIRRIPVVRNDGRLTGMLCLTDLVRQLPTFEVGEILKSVSEPALPRCPMDSFLLPGQRGS